MTRRRSVLGVLIGIAFLVAIVLLALQLGDRGPRAHRRATPLDPAAERTPERPHDDPGDDAGEADPMPDAIFGFVVDERGKPVPAAVVAITNGSGSSRPVRFLESQDRLARTDDAGRFELARPEPAPSLGLVLSVRHPSYRPASVGLGVAADASPHRIVLRRGLSITGTLVSRDGTPVGGVRVAAIGAGATHADGRSDVVAPTTTPTQAVVADARGGFTIGGLEDGWYLLDVVAPGLTAGPERVRRFGGELLIPGTTPKCVRAGDSGVKLTVWFFGTASARVLDRDTGWPLLGAYVSYEPDPAFDCVNQGIMPQATPIIANGVVVRAGTDAPGQSVSGKVFVFDAYPVPEDATCKVKAAAPGYRAETTEVPVRPVGGPAYPPSEIRLSPTDAEPPGALRLVLQDRRGVPITRTRVTLSFRREGEEMPRRVDRIWFDAMGMSDAFALAPGRYTVQAAASPSASPLEPIDVEITPGAVTKAKMLLLQWGGVVLDVRAANGGSLTDYGIRVGRGHVQKEAKLERTERGVVLSGMPIQIAGLGGGLRQLYKLGAGTWAIRIVHPGYAPVERIVECEAGVLTRLPIEMTPSSGEWR